MHKHIVRIAVSLIRTYSAICPDLWSNNQMQIEGLNNNLDNINLSGKEIENQIKSYPLTFSQIRRNDVEWGMKFPMFVPPFYSFI
jgi:hypothetical protein